MPAKPPDPDDGRRQILVAAFGLVALVLYAVPMFGVSHPESGKLFENIALMALAFLAGRSTA